MSKNTLSDFIDDVNSLNLVLHSPTRFIILNILNNIDSCNAAFLTESVNITWGNFTTHITKLEAAGYISIMKSYERKKPSTIIRITDAGKTELETYIHTMRKIMASIDA